MTKERLAFTSGLVEVGSGSDRRQTRVGWGSGRGRIGFGSRSARVESRKPVAAATRAARRDAGYAGLLAFTIVLLLRPQDHLPLLAPLHLAELAAIAGVVPMFWDRLSRELSPVPITAEIILLFAFGLVIVCTAPFSVWPGGVWEQFTDSYVKAVIVYILMINTLTSPERLERFTWLILVCIGCVAVLSLVNYARGVNLVEDGRLAGPVSGIFGNPNDLALNMVTFLPIAAVVAMSRWYPPGRRAGALLIALPIMAVVVFTKSRGGALGLVITLVSLQFLGRTISPRVGIAAAAAVLLVLPLAPSSFWNRMASIADAEQDQKEFTGSREARRLLIQEGINVFLERPLTGVGAGQFKNYNPPGRKEQWRETHNVLLQVAAETGVFGLISFSSILGCAALAAARTRRALKPPRRRSDPDPAALAFTERERRVLYGHAIATTSALIGWLTCAMFASVAYSWTLYYLLGLIVSGREIALRQLRSSV
jgi:O-antigen ligase